MKSLSQKINESLLNTEAKIQKAVRDYLEEEFPTMGHARQAWDDDENLAEKISDELGIKIQSVDDALYVYLSDVKPVKSKGPKRKTEELNEAKVSSKADLKSFAEKVMKKAHGDDYDQSKVDKMVDDLAKEYGDDWGAAVGALTSGLGEELDDVE